MSWPGEGVHPYSLRRPLKPNYQRKVNDHTKNPRKTSEKIDKINARNGMSFNCTGQGAQAPVNAQRSLMRLGCGSVAEQLPSRQRPWAPSAAKWGRERKIEEE